MLHQSGLFGSNFEDTRDTVNHMIDAGSRYKNIERVLGVGVILALGKDISETTWTRLLPKTGEKFDKAMRHLENNTQLRYLGAKYSALRLEVVNQQLNVFHPVQQEIQAARMEVNVVPIPTLGVHGTTPLITEGFLGENMNDAMWNMMDDAHSWDQ